MLNKYLWDLFFSSATSPFKTIIVKSQYNKKSDTDKLSPSILKIKLLFFKLALSALGLQHAARTPTPANTNNFEILIEGIYC